MDGILITGGCYDLPKVAMHFVTYGREKKEKFQWEGKTNIC